ncbi:N-lysine methyltransferase SMYD2-A [Cytospora mali]|uniref:N-lysine methyltransferase SMYD2-A n=1 Tax=Cytospora mali TaxID=578113 RepID=A0A194VK22_CYTMA|nr:N-lysine methyltransferase SMYD2-A [Valsa mali]
MKPSRYELEEEFARMALVLNSGHNLLIGLPSTDAPHKYPPCTKPLSALEPISFCELGLWEHHRGRVLVVRTFCEPNLYRSSILNAIEDGKGDVDRVDLRTFPLTEPANTILPKDAVLAIKEPYYKSGTVDGCGLVRVDHPSDLILLKPGHGLIPSSWMSDTHTNPNLTAIQLKEKGNMAFARGQWKDAAECYSAALSLNGTATNPLDFIKDGTNPPATETSPTTQVDDLSRTLHRNRAQARLNLGQYELAADDALMALIPGDNLPKEIVSLNAKAYFRAGRAFYELGEFNMAHKYLAIACDLIADDKNILFKRTKMRLLEQTHGKFDFAAMGRSATTGSSRLDHASFLSHTRIASAGDRGRGLFATKDLEPSDIILVEKAFHVAFEEDNGTVGRFPYGYNAKLLDGIVGKVRWNPRQAAKYLDLFDGGTFENKDCKIVDGMVVLDIFQVRAIADLNGFLSSNPRASQSNQTYDDKDQNMAKGVWLRASYANHSCLPNAVRSFIGDMMIIRAVRKIKAGDEIFMTYSPCDCQLCQADQAMPPSILIKRDQVRRKVDIFIDANDPTQTLDIGLIANIYGAESLLAQLESTYDNALYGRLPRPSCVLLDTWICMTADTPQAGIIKSLRLLRDLGYFVTVNGGNITIDRSNAIVKLEAIHGAMYASQAMSATGNNSAALAFKNFGKELYVMIHGEVVGFEEEFC